MSITRIDPGPRMSEAVIHGNTIYLAGQVGTPDTPVTQQTQEVLAAIDAVLARCGSSKSKILSATVWLADIADFAAMNAVWDAWVAPGAAPARATMEAKLAAPIYKVEIACVAAQAAK